MDGREGDMLVGDVGPMNGFEIGVLKKAACMHLESLQSVREGSELEGHIRSQHPHFLIMKMSFGSHHWHRQKNTLLATKKVR
jgi:hypothetical protein